MWQKPDWVPDCYPNWAAYDKLVLRVGLEEEKSVWDWPEEDEEGNRYASANLIDFWKK